MRGSRRWQLRMQTIKYRFRKGTETNLDRISTVETPKRAKDAVRTREQALKLRPGEK